MNKTYLTDEKELPDIKYFTYGGYLDAERKIICLCGNRYIEDVREIEFPISCLRITPINQKFSDKLNHRDYLGAVLNLELTEAKSEILLLMNMKVTCFAAYL